MPNNIYPNNVISASNNPQANIQKLNSEQNVQGINVSNPNASNNNETTINPITIPIQLQPQVINQPYTNNNNRIQQYEVSNQTNSNSSNVTNNISTVQQSNLNSRQSISFDDIYKNYQNQFGNTQIKQSTAGTTIVTPTVNTNTVNGQYQSAYADSVNSLISSLLQRLNDLQNGNFYDPTKDTALRLASEYAANTTLESLAGSGILNSSMTTERITRIVSELIPQYEQKAYDRQLEFINQLANTAQLVMDFDSQQFQYWKDAKDREFQEKEFEFTKQQTELENTWKRVDELGYVDNEASAVLGLKVGTLSKDAREAKEQREYELKKMKEQAQLEYENEKALYELRSQLDYEYERKLYEEKSRLDYENERKMYQEKANIDTQKSKELADYEYSLKQKYGTSTVSTSNSSSGSNSSSKTTSNSESSSSPSDNLMNYTQLIEKNWAGSTGTVTQHNTEVYYFLQNEFIAGRLDESELAYLIERYKVRDPSTIQAHAFFG